MRPPALRGAWNRASRCVTRGVSLAPGRCAACARRRTPPRQQPKPQCWAGRRRAWAPAFPARLARAPPGLTEELRKRAAERIELPDHCPSWLDG